MVVNVYAPDSAKNFEEYEKFMQMPRRLMLDGRKEVKRWYFVAGDLCVGLRLFCLEDGDDLQDIYGPQCLCGAKADHGGLKNAMWLEITETDFNCKALSAWLSCVAPALRPLGRVLSPVPETGTGSIVGLTSSSNSGLAPALRPQGRVPPSSPSPYPPPW